MMTVMKPIRIHIIAEAFVGKANGVTTAILELMDALKNDPNYTVVDRIEDADVIHAHTIGLDYMRLSGRYRNKLIVSAHVVPDSFDGSLRLSRLWRPLATMYLRLAYNRAQTVIAVSPTVKTVLERIGVRTPIQVLCNSVDRQKFKPSTPLRNTFRQKYGITDAFVVSCMGQIQPRKGIYDFIQTARLCPDIQFMWVGGTPFKGLTADYNKLKKAIKNAPKNIIFTGIVDFDDMPGYYAMSDVFFMPSYHENFAFATIEASAVHLPLLLRDNPEYPSSLFTHYLKATTVAGFCDALTSLKNDPDCLSHWQNESNQLAETYSRDAYMTHIKKAYAHSVSGSIQ